MGERGERGLWLIQRHRAVVIAANASTAAFKSLVGVFYTCSGLRPGDAVHFPDVSFSPPSPFPRFVFVLGAAKLLSMLQGMVAAFLTQLLTMPIEMVVIRSQSALAGEPTSFRKTMASIIKEGGIGQLWSGLVPNSVLTINP